MSNLIQLYLKLKKIHKSGTQKFPEQYLQNGSHSSILEMNLRSKIVAFSSAITLSVLWLISSHSGNFILLV